MFYLKIFGFLQGSDNQVVIKSLRRFAVPEICMPFSSLKIVEATMEYKSDFKEFLHPKYVIDHILKVKFGLPPNELKRRGELTKSNGAGLKYISLDKIEKGLLKDFENHIDKKFRLR